MSPALLVWAVEENLCHVVPAAVAGHYPDLDGDLDFWTACPGRHRSQSSPRPRSRRLAEPEVLTCSPFGPCCESAVYVSARTQLLQSDTLTLKFACTSNSSSVSSSTGLDSWPCFGGWKGDAGSRVLILTAGLA